MHTATTSPARLPSYVEAAVGIDATERWVAQCAVTERLVLVEGAP
jgi:hypothetical protein